METTATMPDTTTPTDAPVEAAAPAVPDVPVGSRSEIRALQERFKDGKPETIARDSYRPAEFDPDSGYALVFTEKFDEASTRTETSLRVNSPRLLKLFRDHVGRHPSISVGFDEPFEMKAPFQMLFHHWPDFEKLYADAHALPEDERRDLKLLLDLMQGEMGKLRVEVESMKASGQVTFDLLWAIFKPFELVVKYDRGQTALLRLDKTVYESDVKEGRRFEVHGTHTCNDGTGIWLRSEEVEIKEKRHIGGGVPARIADLPIFPYACREAPQGGDDEDMLPALEQRGAQLAKLTGIHTVAYDGPAEYQKLPPPSYFEFCMTMMEDIPSAFHGYYESGRVVVDPKTYIDDFPFEGHKIHRYFSHDFNDWALKTFGSIEASKKILCVPWIYGFSLERKQWCRFYMHSISPVAWKTGSMDALALPHKQKALVEALVKGHHFPDNPREQNAQKGKGLVVLLHGLPGSGKTLTAEVAAEISRAPLLLISLANLYEGSYFEELKLSQLLRWGTIFRAVILIDEADVFLEARRSSSGAGSANTERNALVATFLRHLEYFSGIAFLTSNRVEEFDAAMKSRIHLALQYALPQREVRRQIWTGRLEAIPAGQVGFGDVGAAVDKVLAHELNGREIANAVNTALTLARHEQRRLEVRDLETVVEIWRDFGHSLREIEQSGGMAGAGAGGTMAGE